MAVITIYGERTGNRCREIETQLRISGCKVKYGNPADLDLIPGKKAAGDCTLAADDNGMAQTYISRGSILIEASRSDRTTSLLY